MDLRRSAAIEEWYFGQGDDTRGKVVWYEAAPDAEWFEEETVFRSLNYWDQASDCPARPGVQRYDRGQWSDGATIPGYTGQGEQCGNASWWTDGIPSPPPPNPPADANGIPACCLGGAGVFSIAGATSGGFTSPDVRPIAFATSCMLWSPPHGLFLRSAVAVVTNPPEGIFVSLWARRTNGGVSFIAPPGFTLLRQVDDGATYLADYLLTAAWPGSVVTFGISPDSVFTVVSDAGGILAQLRDVSGGIDRRAQASGSGVEFRTGQTDPLRFGYEVALAVFTSDFPVFGTARLPFGAFANCSTATGTVQLAACAIGAIDYRAECFLDSSAAANYEGALYCFPISAPGQGSLNSSGSSAVVLVGAGLGGGDLVSSGSSAAAFDAAAGYGGDLVSSGSSAAAFDAAAGYGGDLVSSGSSAAAFDAAALLGGALASSGSSTVALVAGGLGGGALASSGSSTVALVGRGLGGGALASSGSSTVALVGRGLGKTALASAGATAASFAGGSATVGPYIVQSGGSSGTNSASPPWNAPTTAGNLLVAVINGSRSGTAGITFSAPAGWTQWFTTTSAAIGFGRCRLEFWTIANAASRSGTETFSATSGTIAVSASIFELAGCKTSGVLDQNAVNGDSSGSTSLGTNTTAATAQAVEIILAAFGQANLVFSGPSTGYNNASTGVVDQAVYTKNTSATGTQSFGGTTGNTTDSWCGAIGTFKAV